MSDVQTREITSGVCWRLQSTWTGMWLQEVKTI